MFCVSEVVAEEQVNVADDDVTGHNKLSSVAKSGKSELEHVSWQQWWR